MTRLVVLLVLVGAFAPAAVLGALPLVLLTMVSIGATMAAVVLARPQPAPAGSAPSAPSQEPLPLAGTATAQARVR
ncbi:MAG TPA: hypothetical protein VH857_13695 [Actinomycetes bacterium]|nr:hypothetical protein [Actinomycetes bacterium]